MHVTLSQMSRHITMSAVKSALCLFCVLTGSGFNSAHSIVATMAGQLLSHRCGFIEKGPCALPNLKLPFLAQFLHL